MRAGAGAGGVVKRGLIWVTKAIAAGGIYAMLLWYGISIFDEPNHLDQAVIALTSLGVTYGISRALFSATSEIAGGIMVLAEFLNRHLLEPQKQRLLRQGREQAREQAMAEADDAVRARLSEARSKLKEQGLNPDDFLPLPDDGDGE